MKEIKFNIVENIFKQTYCDLKNAIDVKDTNKYTALLMLYGFLVEFIKEYFEDGTFERVFKTNTIREQLETIFLDLKETMDISVDIELIENCTRLISAE